MRRRSDRMSSSRRGVAGVGGVRALSSSEIALPTKPPSKASMSGNPNKSYMEYLRNIIEKLQLTAHLNIETHPTTNFYMKNNNNVKSASASASSRSNEKAHVLSLKLFYLQQVVVCKIQQQQQQQEELFLQQLTQSTTHLHMYSPHLLKTFQIVRETR